MTSTPTRFATRHLLALRRRTGRLAAAAALVSALACAAQTAGAQPLPDVGVTVHVGRPGAYGRIDIGRVPPPPPALVYAQPVVAQPPPPQVVVVPRHPVYMRVPPGHRKHWAKHCAKYGVCGVPVHFVREEWWQQQVAARRGAPPHGHAHDPGPAHFRAHPPGAAHGHGGHASRDPHHDRHDKHADKHRGRHGRDD